MLMNKALYIGTITIALEFVYMYLSVGNSQNITSNVMNVIGNTITNMNHR